MGKLYTVIVGLFIWVQIGKPRATLQWPAWKVVDRGWSLFPVENTWRRY